MLREILENLDKEENKVLFYKMYKKPIFLYVLSIAKDYHLSEDITSEIFMKISRYRKTYIGNYGNPEAWVFKIARNTTYTYLKKNKEVLLDAEELDYLMNKDYKENQSDYLSMLENLSVLKEDMKTIVILHVFGGLSHLEISRVLRISYAQVRSKYAYAKALLKIKYGMLNTKNERGETLWL